MSKLFVPIETADLGWLHKLPFSNQFKDIYYSEGGLEQSRYVFIDGNNLIERWSNIANSRNTFFTIAETGFGTGLNFLLTWKLWEQYAPADAQLHYLSCEKHPLTKIDLQKCLSHWPSLKQYADELLENYPTLTPGYHLISLANSKVKLTLMLGDALECFEQLLSCADAELESTIRTTHVDAWYLDGFAPRNNSSMWDDSLIKVIAMLSKEGTSLATFSAAQPVKSRLSDAGFTITKKKGFGPKRHMLTARFSHPVPHRLKKRYTPWHVNKTSNYEEKSATIIGAGLAGCFTAYSLAKKGWEVTVIEEKTAVGMGASGNQQAVLFPKLSAFQSPLTEMMLAAFLYAHRFYVSNKESLHLNALTGSLLLAHNHKELMAQLSLKEWLNFYPDLGELVDIEQASERTGIPLDKTGLYIPKSGWLNAPQLCHSLLNNSAVQVRTNTKVDHLEQTKMGWLVDGKETPVLILTTGHQLKEFRQCSHLPIKPIQGQMTSVEATLDSSRLKIPIGGEGHVLPCVQGTHSVGATYNLGLDTPQPVASDNQLNINKLKKITAKVNWSDCAVDQWAAVRASTPDYLPLVGPIAQADQFMKLYAGLESNANRWIPNQGVFYPGLYSCTGFGSRGLTTIPLCAEWLASLINNEMSSLPRHLIQAISPARFLRRSIIRAKNL